MEHHVSALQVNSLLMSPATSNLINLKKKRVDRSGFSEETASSSLAKKQLCRERKDEKDKEER